MADTPKLDEALRMAQLEFPEIPKDKVNNHFNQRYSSLDAVVTGTRQSLAKYNLLAFHEVEDTELGVRVKAVLIHTESRERREVALSATCDRGRIQELGSRITYLRRYTIAPLLGITPDEDDDGNAASPKQDNPFRREQSKAAASVPTPKPVAQPAPKPASPAPPIAAEVEKRKAEMKGWPLDKLQALVAAADTLQLLDFVVGGAEGGVTWNSLAGRQALIEAVREQTRKILDVTPALRESTHYAAFGAKMKRHVEKLELDKQFAETETKFEQQEVVGDVAGN